MTRLVHSLAITVCVGFLPLQNATATDNPKIIEIDHALQSRDYTHAIALVDELLPAAHGAIQEHLLYRRGLALFYADQFKEAIGQFERQLEQFPDGIWANKARFRQADAHAALKEFDQAERIYGERVALLVGNTRKGELARVYMKFAEEYFAPPDSLTRPDYGRARAFYERALELEPGETLRDDLMFHRAVCNQKLGSWQDAVTQYEEYLTVFDVEFRRILKESGSATPLPAGADRNGNHIIAARLGLAESYFAQGNGFAARRTAQNLLKLLERADLSEPEQRDTNIKALYLLAQTYGIPAPANAEALVLGIETLEKLLATFPDSRPAIQAAHDIGAAYSHLGRSEQAIAAFQALIDRRDIKPETAETNKLAEELSQDALFRIGQLYLSQKKYTDAIGTWNQYVARYPTGPHWSAAQQAIVDAEYRIGADAFAERKHDDARQTWSRFLQEYPLDERARWILYAFGEMAYREQLDLEEAGQKPDWNQPLVHWRQLVSKFPATEEAGAAQFRIGLTLEEKIQDLEAAIKAYRQLSWSSQADAARQRVEQMRATRLVVQTPRSFRTDETPRVAVDVRNIDKLTVKLYRIDMRDYFRKSHGLGGVERLDLLLIDPDRTFEVTVAGYERYKPITQEIEIPFDGPGVYAVNVCNETSTATVPDIADIQRIEATALLIRSDIDVIIKSSRRQVLVFAQNMRTQQPAPDVQVLISDGSKVRFEGTTGADGVWQQKSDDLKEMEQLSVFAEHDGHIAGNALVLHGLEFSSGLQPRGYVYTDRPVYRPAEAVNIRGIVREVHE
ncbi:MAG: tetratricopeptide repeat protein, partial [Planctomycetota bacterium]